jgi:dolichol-phosphate mannosyltransferase
MEAECTLSVIMPSYLEEENLRLLLPRLNNAVSQHIDSYEIIVVDTIKPLDDTYHVCTANNAKYVNRESGNSYGDAVRTGIKEAKGKYFLFMDADGSHPPEFISNMLPYMSQYDVVIASRYMAGGFTENSKLLVAMSRILNIIYSIVLNLRCKDVSNSFKIYNAQYIHGLSLYCNNFDIVEEILFKISKKNRDLTIKEIPFSFKKRMFGETKRNLLIFMISYVFTLLKLRFGK